MAGALTSCAFLGVARITQVTVAAGHDAFVQPILLGFGLISLVVAAAFMIGQTDLKRLLAYSSVEHMGLLVLGLGLGGVGRYGTVLHLLNNGLTKGHDVPGRRERRAGDRVRPLGRGPRHSASAPGLRRAPACWACSP